MPTSMKIFCTVPTKMVLCPVAPSAIGCLCYQCYLMHMLLTSEDIPAKDLGEVNKICMVVLGGDLLRYRNSLWPLILLLNLADLTSGLTHERKGGVLVASRLRNRRSLLISMGLSAGIGESHNGGWYFNWSHWLLKSWISSSLLVLALTMTQSILGLFSLSAITLYSSYLANAFMRRSTENLLLVFAYMRVKSLLFLTTSDKLPGTTSKLSGGIIAKQATVA